MQKSSITPYSDHIREICSMLGHSWRVYRAGSHDHAIMLMSSELPGMHILVSFSIGRYHIAGGITGPYQPWSDRPGITVGADRTSAAIAREICTRLLPALNRARESGNRYEADLAQRRQLRMSMRQGLSRHLCVRWNHSERGNRLCEILSIADGRHVSGNVTERKGDDYDLQLTHLSLAQLLRIADSLSAGEREEHDSSPI